jgi:hypothetical protein
VNARQRAVYKILHFSGRRQEGLFGRTQLPAKMVDVEEQQRFRIFGP